MSRSYKNRKKAIRNLCNEYKDESDDTLKFYAVEHNDRWSGVAAVLVLRTRGIRV